eukprot:04016.XXX_133491_133667_1 [CDS] Oithona nana genome sequencing.
MFKCLQRFSTFFKRYQKKKGKKVALRLKSKLTRSSASCNASKAVKLLGGFPSKFLYRS